MKPNILLLLAMCGVFVLPSRSAERPNILFILADDLGYGDVQAMNPESTIPTPGMNRLASEGMMFTDAHSPSAVCTPTRYGLLTGRYCWRTRLTRGVLDGYGASLIDVNRTTVADVLAATGYRTGVVGKWHLGLDFVRKGDGEIDYTQPVRNGPNDLGFEFSYIIPASLDFPPYVYLRNQQPTMVPELVQPAQPFPGFLREGPRSEDLVMESCLDHLLEEAMKFVRQNANQDDPFFLYFPLTAPHKPVLPHSRFKGMSGLGPYGDFVMQVDWTVGQVLQSLDDLGIASNTLVFLSSDNGSFMYRLNDPDSEDHVEDSSIQKYTAVHHRANGEFRGTKADIWEGGHRVPFLVRWPDVVQAGSSADATVCLTDFFATCAEIIGVPLPENAAEDSFSLYALLNGEAATFRRAPVIHHSVEGMFAIRDGDWKLVLGNGSGGRQAPKGKPFEKPYALFNLRRDIAETQNVMRLEHRVAEELERKFDTIHDLGRSRQ